MRSTQLAVLLVMTIHATRFAQDPALAQRVAEANGNIELDVMAGSPRITLSQMLASTEIIVRGVIGEGVAQFTADGHGITTTYAITNPTVLFSAMPSQVTVPGIVPRALTITLPGGTVPVGRFSATMHFHGVTELKQGTRVIALLQEYRGQYIPAWGAGVFELRQGRVVVLSSEQDANHEFSGLAADEFVSRIVTMRKNAPKK
jgi:hypothetical protein